MPKKRIQIALCGNGCTGKTTTFNAIMEYNNSDKIFTDNYIETEAVNRGIITAFTSDGEEVEIIVVDTAGQEKYGKFWEYYLIGSDVIFIFYDSLNKKSLEDVQKWYDRVADLITAGKIPNTVKIGIVGNKLDMYDSTEAREWLHYRLTKLNNSKKLIIQTFLISAKYIDFVAPDGVKYSITDLLHWTVNICRSFSFKGLLGYKASVVRFRVEAVERTFLRHD